jgi:hypothetical protein
LLSSTVRDSSGDRIGKVGQVYLDDTTGMPEWVTVKTGLFGTRESFVPLAAAHVDGDELVVDVSKDRVSDAPQIDEDGHLSEEQEAELYRYYGVDPGPFGKLPDETLAEPSAGAMDDASTTAVGTLEAPGHEALPGSGYAEGTGTLDHPADPALAAEGDPTSDPTLDPALDAELDNAAGRDTDIVAAIDPDSPALGGPGSASGTPGEHAVTPPPRPHLPPMTTGEAYETSRHGDAMTYAEEKAGTEEVRPGRSRLRRWIAGDS